MGSEKHILIVRACLDYSWLILDENSSNLWPWSEKRGGRERAWQSLTIRLEKWEWFDRSEKINEMKQMHFVFPYEIKIKRKHLKILAFKSLFISVTLLIKCFEWNCFSIFLMFNIKITNTLTYCNNNKLPK